MMTAAATKTTTRDASATVVTKARLRRLGRPRVRKAGWTGSRGSVVWLACSHRASGHDMVGVRSQFGIGGGSTSVAGSSGAVTFGGRSGAGAQTGAGGDFAVGPGAGAAAGSDAGPGAKCTTASTFALRCGFFADPVSDSSEDRRTTSIRRTSAVSGVGAFLLLRLVRVGTGAFSSLSGVVVSVVIPQYGRSGHRKESPFECPLANRHGGPQKRPGGPQDVVALRFCSSALRVVCSWAASVSNCFRKAPSCRGGSESMVSRNWRSWRTCASALDASDRAGAGHRAP